MKTTTRSDRFFNQQSKFNNSLDSLSQLQCGQREQGENQGSDPETHYHLRLGPAQQFEVVMNRRHFKDALLAELVRTDLQDHGQRFDYEYSADEWQQQFLLDDHGDGTNRSA